MNTHLGICILARQRVAIPLERMVAAILYGISLQCVAVGTPRVDTVEALTARKLALEGEMAKVNALIEKAASRGDDGSNPDVPKKYFVEDFGLWDVDSAGGVSVSIVIDNPNVDAPIKYVDFGVLLYNEVGDQLRSRIDGSALRTLNFTGPLEAGRSIEGRKSRWGPLWYESTGACIKMVSVSVTFMNGKRQSFSGASLRNALAPRLTNDCRAGAKQYRDK